MADFEDANSPTWENVRRRPGATSSTRSTARSRSRRPEGKSYRLNDEIATLLVRPRGWHLDERHFDVDGAPVSASLFDFGLYVFRNHGRARGAGTRAVLLPAEARDAPRGARSGTTSSCRAGARSASPRGTIRATVLIETILAAFEMDEILLRAARARDRPQRRPLGLHLQRDQEARPPARVRAPRPRRRDDGACRSCAPTRSCSCGRATAAARTRSAAWRRSSRRAATRRSTRVALAKVREDKEREAGQGFDGTWVAHPGPRAGRAGDLRPRARRAAEPARAAARGRRAATPRRCSTSPRRPGDDHRGRRAQQRLGRHPVPRRLARRARRGRDLQPDGGRRDLRDLALAGLAVAPPRRGRRARTCSRDRGRGARASSATATTRRASSSSRSRSATSSSSS